MATQKSNRKQKLEEEIHVLNAVMDGEVHSQQEIEVLQRTLQRLEDLLVVLKTIQGDKGKEEKDGCNSEN